MPPSCPGDPFSCCSASRSRIGRYEILGLGCTCMFPAGGASLHDIDTVCCHVNPVSQSIHIMNPHEEVRVIVDAILERAPDPVERRCAYVQLYGVSLMAVFLARKRDVDPELAGVAGMLHDLASYGTGNPTDHGPRSAMRAGEILSETEAFTGKEIQQIQSTITHHSNKDATHGLFDELPKDANVLQDYPYIPEA